MAYIPNNDEEQNMPTASIQQTPVSGGGAAPTGGSGVTVAGRVSSAPVQPNTGDGFANFDRIVAANTGGIGGNINAATKAATLQAGTDETEATGAGTRAANSWSDNVEPGYYYNAENAIANPAAGGWQASSPNSESGSYTPWDLSPQEKNAVRSALTARAPSVSSVSWDSANDPSMQTLGQLGNAATATGVIGANAAQKQGRTYGQGMQNFDQMLYGGTAEGQKATGAANLDSSVLTQESAKDVNDINTKLTNDAARAASDRQGAESLVTQNQRTLQQIQNSGQPLTQGQQSVLSYLDSLLTPNGWTV